MQTERRHTPYPLTWEVPAGMLAAAVLLSCLGVHLGRGIANWIAGAGWQWPRPAALFTSLPAVLGGHANAGLDTARLAAASPGTVVSWVVAAEIILLVAGAAATIVGLRRWGPGRLKGMATPAEAEASLGVSRLRRVRHVIRPDLYPSRPQPATRTGRRP